MRHQILLVHDEQTIRDCLVARFDEEGFFGVPAASGQQVLDYLRRGGHASVILLDEHAGWTTVRRAQQRNPALASIPVIAISPLRGSSPRYAAGAPIDVESLIAIVRRLCSRSADATCFTSAHWADYHQVRVTAHGA